MVRNLDSREWAAWSARCRSIGRCSQDVVCRVARVLTQELALWSGTTLRAMHGLNICRGEELVVLDVLVVLVVLVVLARPLRRRRCNEGQCRRAWLVECETPLGLSVGLRTRAGCRAIGVGAAALCLAATTVAAELVGGRALVAPAEVIGPLDAHLEAPVAEVLCLGVGLSALARLRGFAAVRRLEVARLATRGIRPLVVEESSLVTFACILWFARVMCLLMAMDVVERGRRVALAESGVAFRLGEEPHQAVDVLGVLGVRAGARGRARGHAQEGIAAVHQLLIPWQEV
jgi:hypothetical protein